MPFDTKTGAWVPWNLGKQVGQRAPLKPQDVWAIRVRLEIAEKRRDLALINLAVDRKLRGYDLVSLRVVDVKKGGDIRSRSKVLQSKTGNPVQCEITKQTRASVGVWCETKNLRPHDWLFPSRQDPSQRLSTRQYARRVEEWISADAKAAKASIYLALTRRAGAGLVCSTKPNRSSLPMNRFAAAAMASFVLLSATACTGAETPAASISPNGVEEPVLATEPMDPTSWVVTQIYWSDADSGMINGERFRLSNIDAPETGGVGAAIGAAKCEKERERGFAAKEFMVEFTRDKELKISASYGDDNMPEPRLLIDLLANGESVAEKGIEAGFLKAWPHDGTKALAPKPDWCE